MNKPGLTAEDIECYDNSQVIAFLEEKGFERGLFFNYLVDNIKRNSIDGKGLLEKTCGKLIPFCYSQEEAVKLRRILVPILGYDYFEKFDKTDICLWVEALGVSRETLGVLNTLSEDVVSILIKYGCSEDPFRQYGITNVNDISKIIMERKELLDEKNRKKGLRVEDEMFISSKRVIKETPLNKFPSFDVHYKTLEESLKEAGINDVGTILNGAKNKWKESDYVRQCGFSEEEAAAIYAYTYDFGRDKWENNPYRKVNKALGERNDVDLPKYRYFILHLLSALRKLPRFPSEGPLYRGVDDVGEMVRGVGNEMSWPAFTSTSTEKDKAMNFISNGQKPVLFEIHGKPVGYAISKFSAIGGENEVILEPETMFRVKEVKEDEEYTNLTLIVVDVIESPLVIEDLVRDFGIVKSTKGRISKLDIERGAYISKLNALGMVDPPEYCSFEEAFGKAKFGLSYEVLKGEFKDAKKEEKKKEKRRLSDEETLIIFSYTIEIGRERKPYLVVNKALSERDVNAVTVYPYIYHLLGALRKLPLYENNGVLYRGINGEHLNKSTHQVGMTLTWPAFTSTTPIKDGAYRFVLKKNDDGEYLIKNKVIFKITGNVRGYDITDFSMYPGECEVLLEPENLFKITGIGRDNNYPDVLVYSVVAQKTEPIADAAVKEFISQGKT